MKIKRSQHQLANWIVTVGLKLLRDRFRCLFDWFLYAIVPLLLNTDSKCRRG